jgi:LemA protein
MLRLTSPLCAGIAAISRGQKAWHLASRTAGIDSFLPARTGCDCQEPPKQAKNCSAPLSELMNRNVAIGCGCLAVLILAILVLGSFMVGGYNRLVQAQATVDTSWANVQTQYQRRADLIPNLVNTVQGAANFEKSTLTEVINARANATKVTVDMSKAPTDPEAIKRFQQAQDSLSSSLGRLLAVSERYPELKANTNFRDLQAQLEGTENRIAVARRDFNGAAQGYNVMVKSFPTVLYAGLLGFTPKAYFTSAAGAENAPTVSFPSFSPSATAK